MSSYNMYFLFILKACSDITNLQKKIEKNVNVTVH